MEDQFFLDSFFDDLLFQTQRGGVTHEQLERGVRYEQFEQIKEWKSKYGYKFNIYGNDHFIDGKPHFHLDNAEQGVYCKIDFLGHVLEYKGNALPNNIQKELIYFLKKPSVSDRLKILWNKKNPNLQLL